MELQPQHTDGSDSTCSDVAPVPSPTPAPPAPQHTTDGPDSACSDVAPVPSPTPAPPAPQHTTDGPDSACSDVAPAPSPPPADAHKSLPCLLGQKSQMCRYYKTGTGCRFGDRCAFVHNGEELAEPGLKSQMCWYHKTEMGCRFGDRCVFIHNAEEGHRAPNVAKKWVPKTIATEIAKEGASENAASNTRGPQHQSAWDEDDWEWEEDWDFSLYVSTKDGVDGSRVRAEFAGSRLRDRDLPYVFEYLGKELWKVIETRGGDYKLDLDFSVNKDITDKGVADSLARFLEMWPNCHCLKLYKTSCSEAAIRALTPWISLGDVRELHLSDLLGRVSEEAVLELLRQVHRGGNFPYRNSDEAQCALWLRLDRNGIPSEEVVEKAKKEGLSFRVLEKNDLFYLRPGAPTWGRKGKAEAVHLVLFHVQDVRMKRKALTAVAKAEEPLCETIAKAESQDAPDLAEAPLCETIAKVESQEAPDLAEAPLCETIAKVESQEAPDLAEASLCETIAKVESQEAPDLAEAPPCETIAKVESQRARDLAKTSLCRAISEKLQGASERLGKTIAEESREPPDLAKTSLGKVITRDIVARRRKLGQAHRVGDSARQQTENATAPAQPPGHKCQSKGPGSLAAVLRNIPPPKQDVSTEPSSVE